MLSPAELLIEANRQSAMGIKAFREGRYLGALLFRHKAKQLRRTATILLRERANRLVTFHSGVVPQVRPDEIPAILSSHMRIIDRWPR